MVENLKETRLFIGGAWSEAESGRRFDDLNPETGALYGRAALAAAGDVARAVAAAKAAFPKYASTTVTEREALLFRASELLLARKTEFVDALVDEIGSPLRKAEHEFGRALTFMRAAAGMVRTATGKTIPSDVPGRISMSMRAPLGVVAAITPFNVPLIKGVRLTANPLALGNTVVLLCSEEAPIISGMLAKVYEDAGFPAGTFNLVTGYGVDIGDALTGHPDVAMVTFTGSSRVGKHIQSICARDNKRVTLELGGKSPMVVLADANIPKAVAAGSMGIFTYQGQVCMGNSRIYVEEGVYDEFVKKFVEFVSRLGIGDLRSPETVIGPIISERQRKRVQEHILDAVHNGAQLLTGGKWHGNRMEPTVLAGVKDGMLCARDETFGPVVSVYSVSNYEEALRLANDSNYGLSSAIFTSNIDKALHFAQHVEAGMCHINTSALQDEAHVPFGGTGDSGFGKEGTGADIEVMSDLKWVTINS
ncbi:aldehyde dehydrogenase family protein [Mesorhizobium sp. M0276]|uniref:aldehyde dehydrogenase family protein n=1 Tax=Mesorhizobium sp. M0276 TaxID=2956928 RepID=UPI003334E78C